MIAICTTILFFIAFMFMWHFNKNTNKQIDKEMSFLSGAISLSISICALASLLNKEPKAIDVYRNNTTLKITYINNVPVDTVVIFKKK